MLMPPFLPPQIPIRLEGTHSSLIKQRRKLRFQEGRQPTKSTQGISAQPGTCTSEFRDRTLVSCGFNIAGRFFTAEPLGKPQEYCSC